MLVLIIADEVRVAGRIFWSGGMNGNSRSLRDDNKKGKGKNNGGGRNTIQSVFSLPAVAGHIVAEIDSSQSPAQVDELLETFG